MGTLTAQEVLDVVSTDGIQVKLTEDFDLDVFPASKLQPTHLLVLRAEKQRLVKHLSREVAKELKISTFGGKKLFNNYHGHHFTCPQCKAAGLGYGKRCSEGKPLWFMYQLEAYVDD